MDRDRIVERAEKLVAAGKLQAAIQQYEVLVGWNPQDVSTLNRIGDLWARLGHNHSAVAVYRRIAEHYASEGFFLKAIAILKKIDRLDPNDLSIYTRLADLYARQGLIAEARAQYSVVAEAYLRRNDTANALMAYERSSELDDKDLDTATRVAELLAQVGRPDESDQAYRRLVLHALRRSGPAEIVRVARSAIRFHPGGTRIARWCGEVLVEQKQLSLSISLLQEIDERPDVEPETIVLLGRALVASGDLRKARGVFDRGLNLFPTHETIRKNVAGLALIEGDSDRALDLVTPLLNRSPEHVPVVEEAVEPLFDPGHELDEDPELLADERINEADVYASYGLSVPAVHLLEQVLAARADYPPALERLLRLALADDRNEEAVRIATKLLPLLYRDGMLAEVERVQDDLRKRDLLDPVMINVDVPARPELPESGFSVKDHFEIDVEVEDDEVAAETAASPVALVEPAAVVPRAEEPAPAAVVADEGPNGKDEVAARVDELQRLIARRKITRATKMLDELLLKHPGEPELMSIRDGLRARGFGRKRTRPGEPLPVRTKDERGKLEVN